MGLRINKLLEEKNISIAELGRKMNPPKSRSTLQATVEKGNPQYSKLVEIAEALGVDITELFEPNSEQEFNALVEHKGVFYKATTVEELQRIVNELKAGE